MQSDGQQRPFVPLNREMQQIYERLVVKCKMPNCKKAFKLKDRTRHYEKKCAYFKYYDCEAEICKIKQLSADCGCDHCEKHDCYNLSQHKRDHKDKTKRKVFNVENTRAN